MDLVQKLSGLKQYPETGRVYNRDQWRRENVYISKKESKDEGIEDEEENVWLTGKHLSIPFILVIRFYIPKGNI